MALQKRLNFGRAGALFNEKTVRNKLTGREFTQAQVAAAKDWAARVRHANFRKAKETSVRGEFIQKVLVTILGYKPYHPGETFTIAEEETLGRGSVDTALGAFSHTERTILAPFELKGPKTHDLDAIMQGRNKSPVQQAWEYAIDAPGAKWVLVSNCAEIRLYAFGHGRELYETWDLQFLDEPKEHERLWLFLGMQNLLNGRTAALLEESANEQKVITKKLYVLYKETREKLIQTLKDQPPHLAPLTAIEHAQTILDRVLFIAFAEKNSLLPPRQIRKAWRETSEFSPNSAWQNFVGLFEAVDKGKPKLDIPAYNGGLFAKNPIIDALSLPYYVCEYFDKIADYDFATEVPVSVLGHIFEQSVSDTEKERAEAQGEAPPKTTKRKRDGVVYTPDFVTRFIVEETIGNPPYVRQETIKPFKSYLNRHYSSYHSSLDLYGYFYELALRISKNGGRIGFISSYSFLKTSSARDLRRFLIIHSNLETFVDFGDIKVFDDVTTYPVIITANKAQTIINSDIKFTNLRNLLPDDLHASFLRNHDTMASTDLSLDAWAIIWLTKQIAFS